MAYHIMKIASKKLIDEWPEGNDFELSLINNCLSTVFVQVYSEMNSLKWRTVNFSWTEFLHLFSNYLPEQFKNASGWHVSKKCGRSSPTNTCKKKINSPDELLSSKKNLVYFRLTFNPSIMIKCITIPILYCLNQKRASLNVLFNRVHLIDSGL